MATDGATDANMNSTTQRARRRAVMWAPGTDTALAAGTLLSFWGCCWAGTTISPWFLYLGIVVVATGIPAWTVLHQRSEGLDGLGIRRRFLIVSLLVSVVLGGGSPRSSGRSSTRLPAASVPCRPGSSWAGTMSWSAWRSWQCRLSYWASCGREAGRGTVGHRTDAQLPAQTGTQDSTFVIDG